MLVGTGPYKWYLDLIGVLAVAVGSALGADYRGVAHTMATTYRNRFLAAPISDRDWYWRLWGGFMAVCGGMMLIQ